MLTFEQIERTSEFLNTKPVRPPLPLPPKNEQMRAEHLSFNRALTSGAKNSGVPQKVPVLAPKPIPSLHKPKSAILT